MASADAVQIDGIYYNLDAEAKTAEVTSNPDKYSGSISIPETVFNYNDGVKYDVTSIGDQAFRWCHEITSIVFPTQLKLKSIGFAAMYACSKLTSVVLPEGLVSIGQKAFTDCTSLESVTVPSTVTKIDPSAFNGCPSLTSFICKIETPLEIKESVFGDRSIITLYVPEGCKDAYVNSEYWQGFKEIVEGGEGTNLCPDSNHPHMIDLGLPSGTKMYTFDSSHGAELKVPTGTKEKYLALDYWKDFKNIVEMDDQVVEQGYAVFDSETGTLTFKYGEKPAGDNVYDTDNTDYTWESQAWDCSQIKKVVFDPSFAAARPKSTTHWFYKSESLTEIVGIEYLNTSEVTTMRGMFSGCGNLTNLDVHKFVTDNVTNMAWMFENCSSLKSLDVSKFNTSNVTDLGAMFDNCPSLTNLDVSHFDTGNAKSLNSMFRGCSGLTSLDVSNFNTGNATDVCGMFENCSSLKSLDVSKFNTSNVTDLGAMFANCPSLTSLDVRHFDTSNAKSLNSMFRDCSGLTLIDLSSFDTSNAINMGAMFKNCNSLTTIHVGEKWNTTNVEDSDEMFAGCEKLVGGTGTRYDESHTDHTYARIDGGASNPGYFTEKSTTDQEDVDEITIKEIGKTTWCSEYDLDFTNVAGIKAYTATGYDDISKTIWLTRVMKVPAGTGLLVKGDAGTYKIPHVSVRAYYTNMLVGNLGDAIKIAETDGDKTNYYLSGKDGTFVSVNGSANIGKNKAYLQLPTSVFGGTRSIGISYDDEDGSTGINVQSSKFNVQSDAYYTLQGQRVVKPGKGLYIKNGKKVVIK